MQAPIIIIGTGFAGYQLAREFRKLDQTSPLVLITANDGRAYPKPRLSTAFTQKKLPDDLTEAPAEKMAVELNATILTLTTVISIDPATQSLTTDKQQTHTYSQLILACGADTIQPELTGDAVDDILAVNHLHDYAQFRDAIKNKKKITILGAGLIGCEFANDLTNGGFDVDVISPAKSPLDLLLPEEIGAVLQKALEKNGVHFHFQCVAKSINKNHAENQPCYQLTLSNNTIIHTDFVLSAIGLRPHVALAKKAGIAIQRGIIVNRYLETNQLNIYALGDCAEVEGYVLPYIAPIRYATQALAATLAGTRTAVNYPAMPISVKTPAHPIVICPPRKKEDVTWETDITDMGVRALCFTTTRELVGFILTDKKVVERAVLLEKMPALF